MFFSSTRYVCLCGNTAVDPVSKLPSSLTKSNLHHLGDLYFCPECQMIKCVYCCDMSVQCKYCVNCMTDYTDVPGLVRCTKNCFECPMCRSTLTVSMEDASVNDTNGKRFTFNCVWCDFTYKTEMVTKPAALSTIVKNENFTMFSELYKQYSQRQKRTEKWTEQLHKSVVSRMKAMDIPLPEMQNLELKRDFPLERAHPLGKPLTAKRKYLCGTCRSVLIAPVADPRLMKITTKQFAYDIVPTISTKVKTPQVQNFSPGTETECTFNIINATSCTIDVTVSILSQLPNNFMDNNTDVSISFPYTHFSVLGQQEKTVVDSIPLQYLTNATVTARAEQLVRVSRRETRKRENKEAGVEDNKEIGTNWVSVPFSVSFGDIAPSTPPYIPFYVTIESKVPQQWKANKRGLKYGFWVVCQVET